MIKNRISILLTCLLLVFLATSTLALGAEKKRTLTAVAKVPAASEAKVALVIGNSRYHDMPLKNPGNDARAMAAKLRSLGFQVVLKENLGAMQIGSALREFKNKLSPGAVALFYYAGHGLQVKGVNYLPAVDAMIESEEDVPRGSLNVNEVLGLMEESKTRLNLVFLDACRNNPYARSFRSTAGGLAKLEAPSGTLISFATRPGSVAADGGGKNGIYTEQLLRIMEQPGLQIEQVLKQVTSQVKRASGGKQEPWMEGSIEGEFYFQPPQGGVQPYIPTYRATSEPSVDIEQEFWNRIKDSKSATDYEAYLTEYPGGRYVNLAKLEISRYLRKQSSAIQSQIFQAGELWDYEGSDNGGVDYKGTLSIIEVDGLQAKGIMKFSYTSKSGGGYNQVAQKVSMYVAGNEITVNGYDVVKIVGDSRYNPDSFFLTYNGDGVLNGHLKDSKEVGGKVTFRRKM